MLDFEKVALLLFFLLLLPEIGTITLRFVKDFIAFFNSYLLSVMF